MSRRRLRRQQRKAYAPEDQLLPTQVSGAFNVQNYISTHGADAINVIPPQTGLANSQSPDPGLNFNATEAEKVIKNPAGNSYIIFGRDRPSSQVSGYGSIGASRCDTIDIVVGRMASARQGRGARIGTYVENHFGLDAARIYISALTDVDQNFGLAEGVCMSRGRSAIGMKADAIRVIGREGVKIITGRSYAFTNFGSDGETNSVGGRTQRSPAIELNAGNQPKEELQGVALGDNTVKALDEMATLVDALIGGMLRSHTVMSAFLAFAGGAIPPLGPGAGVTSTEYIRISLESLYALKNQVNSFKLNYIIDNADRPIASKNVYTT